jgi:hypothetical protein
MLSSSAENVLIDGNVTSESSGGDTTAVRFSDTFGVDTDVNYTNNTLINSGPSSSDSGTFAGTISGNSYHNSTPPTWDPNPASVSSVAAAGWDNQFCTTIKRITDPTVKCFDNASLTATSLQSPVIAITIIDYVGPSVPLQVSDGAGGFEAFEVSDGVGGFEQFEVQD